MRIVQLSDLHLGLIHREGKVREVLKLVQKADPDLLVFTGDTVDASFRHLESAAALLADVNPPLGKYGVTGNHEYHAGLDHSMEFFDRADITVLRGESRTVGNKITLVGVDDPMGGHRQREADVDEDSVLFPRENDYPTVLLKHRPQVSPEARGHFTLQLSGHSHGGQIFPFSLVARAYHRYDPGLHKLPNGGWLYVTTGCGTWGPPFRVGAPPEIPVFILRGPPATGR